MLMLILLGKTIKNKIKTLEFSKNEDDQNEDQQSQVLIGESIPPLSVNEEDMDTNLSSKELVVPRASLGVTKVLNETDSGKELVLSMNLDTLPCNL
jgi:hypothetical protein